VSDATSRELYVCFNRIADPTIRRRLAISFVRFSSAHFVETQTRRFERLERALLHLCILGDRRPVGYPGKRAAGHRSMVRMLRFLQCGEGFLVLALPPLPDA
jgi:hypothetical protein